MGKFTISQQPENLDLYLYPNADVCANLSKSGCASNYLCVDEDRENPDDDSTYVYNSSPSVSLDIYGLPNSADLGTINYVEVFTRAKSNLVAPDEDAEYYILIDPDSECTDEYASGNIQLITSYSDYSYAWTENPKTDADWTWADINSMGIGLKCSSPTYTTSRTLTLLPNGDGTYCGLYGQLCGKCGTGNHYNCVTSTSPPQAYCSTVNLETNCPADSSASDTFEMENHTTETGTITKVTIYERLGKSGICNGTANILLLTHGTLYEYETSTNLPDGWGLFTKEFTTNPNTSAAWTWDEIDAMEIGIKLKSKCNGSDPCLRSYCDQIYVVVTYLAPSNPDIRTTQCYAKVNYQPASATCALNKPTMVSTDHSRNVMTLNFWSGNRAVYDVNRSGKSMVLTGSEWYDGSSCTDPCANIECIRQMAENGADVTVSGLGDWLWNGVYKIRSIGWTIVTEKPARYDWIIELEDTRYCSECGDETYLGGD